MVEKFEVGKKYKYRFPNWEPTHGPYECIFVTPSGSGVLSFLKDGEAIEWVAPIPENFVEVPKPPPRRVLYRHHGGILDISFNKYTDLNDFGDPIGFVTDEDLLKIATKE